MSPTIATIGIVFVVCWSAHSASRSRRRGFGNWFREMCDQAGLREFSAHGLRKAACTRLAQAGCTAREIAAISGHRSLSEVARYTRAADQEAMAEAAMAKMRTSPVKRAAPRLSNKGEVLGKKDK
jgi:integrase